jgi:hypothetical protein
VAKSAQTDSLALLKKEEAAVLQEAAQTPLSNGTLLCNKTQYKKR